MKKALRAALSLAILCFLAAIPAPKSAAVAQANPIDAFAVLPEKFTFASGAGGWWTDVHINADGTFSGFYEDGDMGATGEGYPNGTRYECRFSGAFTDVRRASEFEYAMRIASLHTEGVEGEEKIIDGVKVITAGPYGFDDAGEFRLYLTGKKIAELPDAYVGWVGGTWAGGVLWGGSLPASGPETLPFYGLYNVGGEQGFYSDDPVTGSPSWGRDPLGPAATEPFYTSGGCSTEIIGTVAVTNADSVVVRNLASMEGNPLVCIYPGKTYACVGQAFSGWYKVFASDYIGYVPNDATTYTAYDTQPGQSTGGKGFVKITSNDFANIRSAPNQDSEWLAGVSPGIILESRGKADNGWYSVVLPSGEVGYVSNKLCEFQ